MYKQHKEKGNDYFSLQYVSQLRFSLSIYATVIDNVRSNPTSSLAERVTESSSWGGCGSFEGVPSNSDPRLEVRGNIRRTDTRKSEVRPSGGRSTTTATCSRGSTSVKLTLNFVYGIDADRSAWSIIGLYRRR
ncbi:uncharacterized protein LOC143423297 [Xylocopa sonorina]|uniref:uncharacterized protein LOC143423297 n=1 Tax=Xylocopa sonorina TaxID=1818115 RepID=UPI00403A9234